MQQVTLKEQMEHTQMQMDYRLMQAEQAVQVKERKNREVHTGAVTDEFFKYFGSSAR